MAYIDTGRYIGGQKTMEMGILTMAAFIAPFLIHQQIFLGILINALLVRSAFSLPGNKALPVIMAPSIGSLMNGLLFGPFTVFLAYMMPVIWLGNGILVHTYKRFGSRNYPLTLLFASSAKSAFLFTAAYILYSASLIPEMFLSAMGLMQFSTAVLGGVVAYLQLRMQG